MARTTVITLTDDIDGGKAEETVTFSLDGKSYEIDLGKKNANALRKAFQPYIDAGRRAGGRGRVRSSSPRGSSTTLFSQLDAEEKDRFRAWADMPNARRISDARVQEWMDAGKP